MLSPAKLIYANVPLCKSLSVTPPALVVAKYLPAYQAALPHLCSLHLSNLHLSLRRSLWKIARPARQLSRGMESQHLVAGSDQSILLETPQHQRTRVHTLKCKHTLLPSNSRERENES